MRFLLLLSIFTCFTSETSFFAQDSGLLQSILYSDEYTQSNSKTSEQIDSFYFNLPLVSESPHQMHIRIKTRGQIIDLYCDENKKFSGVLVTYINEYKYTEENDVSSQQSYIHQTYFQKFDLDTLKVKSAFNFILSTKFNDFSTADSIEGWHIPKIHCSKITFTYNINGLMKSQVYSCTENQSDNLPAKQMVMNCHDMLSHLFETESIMIDFYAHLPENKIYSQDGYMFMSKNQSTQRRKLNRRKPKRS